MAVDPPPRPEDVFADALVEGAARLRWSRADVAAAAGVTPRTVSRWRMGDLLPHPDRRAQVLAAFAPAGLEVITPMQRALGLAPAVSPSATPAPVRRDAGALRKELELALHAAAERLDRSPRRTRRAVIELLATLEATGVSPREAKAWLEETERQTREARARSDADP